MITAICSLVFLGLGIWLGFVRGHARSEARFSSMCDDGQLVWRYEEDDGEEGWVGSEDGIESVVNWAWKRN